MKFLIQKVEGVVVHDFSFTLVETIRYNNWLRCNKDMKCRYYYTFKDTNFDEISFRPYHKNCIPIGSVEFVISYLRFFGYNIPKPINVPKELMNYNCSRRTIINGTEKDVDLGFRQTFVKSNDKIKGITEIVKPDFKLPEGNYQFSELVFIESEWRVFVLENKIVGLQNYSGECTMFPDLEEIKMMIDEYSISAPIVYTLDVGVDFHHTFVIECHDFFSCGLYGFNGPDLPQMYNKWFKSLTKK